MALVQAAEHLIQDLARSVHAVGGFHLWPELVVDRLPVQAAGLGLPVLVADRGPHVLERLDIELPLFRRERRSYRTSNQKKRYDRDAADRITANHSFSRTLAPSAPPM